MNQEVKDIILNESKYPPQNPDGMLERVDLAVAEERDVRIGCFVCLPNEWQVRDNKLAYSINTGPNVLSRLEGGPFVDRTLELLSELDASCIPFKWDFIIADTDLEDVYADLLVKDTDPRPMVEAFQQRIAASLGSIMPEATGTPLWSSIQTPYQTQYRKDYEKILGSRELKTQIDETIGIRLDHYRRFFAKKGVRVSDAMLAPLCRDVARKIRALYGAQGPIINQEYDLLVIGDRDPRFLGQNQSVLAPDLPIWYPYSGG